jgi:hypothetical protein
VKRNTASRGANSRPARFLVLAAVAAAGALIVPAPASAHDLKAVVTVHAGTVTVEAGYDDDTPAEKARVTVADATGSQVAAGTLDENGVWKFPTPAPGDYRVVVESAGHRDEVPVPIRADPGEATYSGWRLDKRLGLAAGVGLLLGGTLAFVYFRRPARPPELPSGTASGELPRDGQQPGR